MVLWCFPSSKQLLHGKEYVSVSARNQPILKAKFLAIFSNLVHFSLLLGGIQPVSYEVPSPCHVR